MKQVVFYYIQIRNKSEVQTSPHCQLSKFDKEIERSTLMEKTMNQDDPIIQWLLRGDPAVRWQVQRDLLHASKENLSIHAVPCR
jgi:hypothetical protein